MKKVLYGFGGLSDGYVFSTDNEVIPIVNEKKYLKHKYVIYKG